MTFLREPLWSRFITELTNDQRSEVQAESTRRSQPGFLLARLAVGLVVLICAEVFSGASLAMGLWHPWTLVVTYWLYYAHFFFFTTLAVRTGRTSLSSLYLWGVLFGLYESWITKVIWHGYSGDGKFVLGSIGPYGFSEISMVFLFHPVMSFILPLSVACLLSPSLRRVFPDLAWLTGRGRWARCIRAYVIISLAPVMAMNSGGPMNLILNIVAAIVCLLMLLRLARSAFESPSGQHIVVFSRWGFAVLCLYLAVLYGVTYILLRPEGLPSIPVQLFTFVFYALAIVGLWLGSESKPLAKTAEDVDKRGRQVVVRDFAVLVAMTLLLSMLAGSPFLYIPIMVNFVVWTPLGLLLTALAFKMNIMNIRRSPLADDGDSRTLDSS